jgi:hypothetical protein
MTMTGHKYDTGKLRYDLIPEEVTEQLARILTFGSAKYADNNWKFLRPFKSRYFAALMRHIAAWRGGEDVDKESGELHLSHALACLSFLLWGELNKSKKLKVYVASPYTIGDHDKNVEISLKAGDELLKKGFVPICPLLSHFWDKISPKSYDTWLDMDLQLLAGCDAVLRLLGASEGADKEVKYAMDLGIPVYFVIDDIGNWKGRIECVEN